MYLDKLLLQKSIFCAKYYHKDRFCDNMMTKKIILL